MKLLWVNFESITLLTGYSHLLIIAESPRMFKWLYKWHRLGKEVIVLLHRWSKIVLKMATDKNVSINQSLRCKCTISSAEPENLANANKNTSRNFHICADCRPSFRRNRNLNQHLRPYSLKIKAEKDLAIPMKLIMTPQHQRNYRKMASGRGYWSSLES